MSGCPSAGSSTFLSTPPPSRSQSATVNCTYVPSVKPSRVSSCQTKTARSIKRLKWQRKQAGGQALKPWAKMAWAKMALQAETAFVLASLQSYFWWEAAGPDLPLPYPTRLGGDLRTRGGQVWERRWPIEVENFFKVMVERYVFKPKAGRGKTGCGMGKEGRLARDQISFGEHAGEVGCLVPPPAPYFDGRDVQSRSSLVWSSGYVCSLFLRASCKAAALA